MILAWASPFNYQPLITWTRHAVTVDLVNKKHSPNVGLMLAHRLRRCVELIVLTDGQPHEAVCNASPDAVSYIL